MTKIGSIVRIEVDSLPSLPFCDSRPPGNAGVPSLLQKITITKESECYKNVAPWKQGYLRQMQPCAIFSKLTASFMSNLIMHLSTSVLSFFSFSNTQLTLFCAAHTTSVLSWLFNHVSAFPKRIWRPPLLIKRGRVKNLGQLFCLIQLTPPKNRAKDNYWIYSSSQTIVLT